MNPDCAWCGWKPMCKSRGWDCRKRSDSSCTVRADVRPVVLQDLPRCGHGRAFCDWGGHRYEKLPCGCFPQGERERQICMLRLGLAHGPNDNISGGR